MKILCNDMLFFLIYITIIITSGRFREPRLLRAQHLTHGREKGVENPVPMGGEGVGEEERMEVGGGGADAATAAG